MNETTTTPVATATPSTCTVKCDSKPAAAPAAQPNGPAPQAPAPKGNRRMKKH